MKDRVTGSIAQMEKRKWQMQNSILLQSDEKHARAYSKFLRSKDPADTAAREKRMQDFQNRLSLLKELRSAIALDYIKANPNSYFSGAIFKRYIRLYTVDTIMQYFKFLSFNVQQSTFGKYILSDALARSDNWQLFSDYLDSATYKKVKDIRSLYDVSLPSLKGDTVSLSKYKGKIILIDFWASWCTPCVRSIPALNRLMVDVKGLPIVILPVSVDVNEPKWRNAIESHKFKTEQLLDKQGLLAAYYKVLGYPTYVIIDHEGKLIDGNAPSPNEGESLKNKLIELADKIKK